MRKLWLLFAQAVTLTLAMLFVVSLVKPDWLAWRAQVVEVRESLPAPVLAPATASRLSFSDAAGRAIPAVVNISATREVKRRNPLLEDPAFQRFFGERFSLPNETQLSLGSGVIVSREGYILTNNHVVEGVTDIQVTLDGRTGRIVGTDPDTDLAVVHQRERPHPHHLRIVEQAKVGDIVLDRRSVQRRADRDNGIISRGASSGLDALQQLHPDRRGHQQQLGGALVDTSGNLIGVNTLIFSRSGGYQGIGFAVPINGASAVLEQTIETGSVTRGWFGVEVADITPEIAESLGLKGTQGAIIGAIERGSPAERSGMRLGDVIVAVNGKSVANSTATLNAIAGVTPGMSVPVKVMRRNRDVTLDIMVGKRKPRPRTED